MTGDGDPSGRPIGLATMNSPVLRYIMATLFTVVCVTFTFILVGFLVGQWIGQVGMMVTLLVSTVGYWILATRLFNILGTR